MCTLTDGQEVVWGRSASEQTPQADTAYPVGNGGDLSIRVIDIKPMA